MKKLNITLFALAFSGSTLASGLPDDPLLFMFKLDKAEYRNASEGDVFAWDAQAWLGKDLNKLWLKSEGEILEGDTEEGDLEVLYSRAVAPFWDLQVGWRHDFEPTPSRDWFAFGVKGLAPTCSKSMPLPMSGNRGACSSAPRRNTSTCSRRS